MYQALFYKLGYSREETDENPCPHGTYILDEETKNIHDKTTHGTLDRNECRGERKCNWEV